jgi:hypothetical protein
MLDLMPYMKYLHASYSGFIALLVFYQGWIGFKIRNERLAGRPPIVKVVRRHRKMGPILTLMGIAGFFAGAITVYLNEGRFFEHPIHFVIGLLIAAFVSTTFVLSKKIKSQDSPLRNTHFIIGLVIICLYCIQIFVGTSMLLRASH